MYTDLPATTHLLLAAIGGALITVALYYAYKWVDSKVNPKEVRVYDKVWIGDHIRFTPKGINTTIKGRVVGFKRASNSWKEVDIIVSYRGNDLVVDAESDNWEKV